MEIKFQLDRVDGQYAINVAYGIEGVNVKPLASGFASSDDAVAALIECLTIAVPPPPDLSLYDEALGHVGQLLDGVNALNVGITQIAERVDALEQAAQQPGAGPEQQALVPGRSLERQFGAIQPPRSARPSIRRQPAEVHHPRGGAFRPGEPQK